MHAAQGTHGDVLSLVAVGSGFASRCVSVLASGILFSQGQNLLPLVLLFPWQWEEGLVLAWVRVMDQRTSCRPIHLCVLWLYNKPCCTLCKAFCGWGALCKSQRFLLFMLFIYWSHFSKLRNGEKKKKIADSLCLYLISLSVFGEYSLVNVSLSSKYPGFTQLVELLSHPHT